MKIICFLIMWISSLIYAASSCYAQAPGLSEFTQVSAQMRSYYFSFSDLSFAIGAITGLIGGVRIYSNWQSGDYRVDAQVTAWFASCIFLNLCGIFLRGLFGL